MNESLQAALRKLRLSGLVGTLDVRLEEAAGNRLNHAEFLELTPGSYGIVDRPGLVRIHHDAEAITHCLT